MKLYIPLQDGTTLMFEGSCDELVLLAEKFVEKHGSTVAFSSGQLAVPDVPASKANSSRRWTEQTVKRLWALLYGEQVKLVKFLVERGGKAAYSDVGKHMGYQAQRLSGILSPITRNAQTATGDRLARLVDWRITEKGIREYYVDAEALPLLQRLLKQPGET